MATLRFGLLPSEPLKINEILLRKLSTYSGASLVVRSFSGVGGIKGAGEVGVSIADKFLGEVRR